MKSVASSLPNRFIPRFAPSLSSSSSSSRLVGLQFNKNNNGGSYLPLPPSFKSSSSQLRMASTNQVFLFHAPMCVFPFSPIFKFYVHWIWEFLHRMLPLLPMPTPNLMSFNPSKPPRFSLSPPSPSLASACVWVLVVVSNCCFDCQEKAARLPPIEEIRTFLNYISLVRSLSLSKYNETRKSNLFF